MKINFDNIILNKDDVLNRTSEEAIYEYYLHTDIKTNKLIKCPFHNDKDPSLGFYKSYTNNLNYKCFGCGEQGNVFNFVMKLDNINYSTALKKIVNDLNLVGNNIINNCEVKPKSVSLYTETNRTKIIPVFRNFTKVDYDYWNKFYIPLELLIKYNIKACEKVFITKKNGETILIAEHSNSNPIYCYILDDTYKIYRPLNPSKIGKWFNSAKADDIQGMKQLPNKGDLLIITSSMKDVLVLSLFGYNAIALGGEGNRIPERILDLLYALFPEILVFYDNDKPGIMYGKKISEEIGCNYIYIPIEYDDTKDISDFIAKYGYEETKILLNSII